MTPVSDLRDQANQYTGLVMLSMTGESLLIWSKYLPPKAPAWQRH